MELKTYLQIFSRYKTTIIICLLAGILIASLISIMRAQQHEASLSLIIRPKVIEKTENFQFSDVLEASDRITRMSENWINEQSWSVGTRRLGNQLIAISFSAQNQEASQAQTDEIIKKSNAFLASLSPTSGFGAFEALGSDFSFGVKNPYWMVSLIAGAIVGLVVGLFCALFRHYLSP